MHRASPLAAPLAGIALASALALALASAPSTAAGAEPPVGPNVLVRIAPADKAGFVALRDSGLDIIHIHGNEFDVLVTDEELAQLRSEGFVPTILDDDVLSELRDIKRATGSLIGNYTTYAEMVARLQDRVAAYPAIASLQSIGTSWEGRDLWALKISDNVAVDEAEPEVLYMGTYHARELITVEIGLALADSLLMNYGSDARLTEWVDSREIWFVPMVNPDGHVWVENVDTNWRKNRRNNGGGVYGVDLNRNHEYEWGHDDNGSDGFPSGITYRGPSPASEPEVQAIQAFVDAHEFVFSLSFHSYGNWWLWGPGWEPGLSPDQDVFAGYGSRATAFNGYVAGNAATGTIYITNGDVNDWLYFGASHGKTYGMTPEVGGSSDGFYPPESRIPALVGENIEPSWVALEFADRPERLAPPGPPALTMPATDADGDFTVTWDPPTEADTQPVSYEVTEKTGPTVVTQDLEIDAADWDLGGWSRTSARASSGSWSLRSGSGDNLNRICMAREAYVVQPGDSLTFRAWYSIESNWDYAYAMVSTDGGRSFRNLDGTNTTGYDPNGNNAGRGITGSSGGWIDMAFDLSGYVGQSVRFAFRYWTDGAVQNEGFYVDDVRPVQRFATSAVLDGAVAGTSLPLAGRPAGDWWYSVRGLDAEGDWGYPSDDAVVSVGATDVRLGGSGPDFALASLVPNPFAGATSVRFTLPAPGDVSLAIHDVAGRRVRSLVRGTLAAGSHEAVWDGRDESGRPAASGVYFVRLRAAAGELQRRVVLRR